MDRHQKERSPEHLSDEELDYYGNLYVEHNIKEAGLDFESFLSQPERYLQKYAQGAWRAGRDDARKGREGLLRYLRPRPTTRTPSH